MANPVKEAPGVVRSTVAPLCVALLILDIFHAEIVPFRLAKMKRAGPPAIPNDIPELPTMPVGPLGTPPPGMAAKFVPGVPLRFPGAMVELPVTAYRLDVPVTWLSIQKGDAPGMAVRPHVFFRFGSVIVARPEMSEARAACLNCAWAIPPPAHSAPKPTVANMTARNGNDLGSGPIKVLARGRIG